MKVEIQLGQLAEAVEEFKNIKLQHNKEVDIRDMGCQILTPFGNATINYIIKKEGLCGLKITLENGIEIKCADKHVLQKHGKNICADELVPGDEIDTINGSVKVMGIEKITDTVFYDIGIDWPHLYYDANGVLHHNTLITAALSYFCEPYGRTIVIVPSKQLVEQTESDYKNLGLDVGVFYGNRKEYNRTHTIATWQSLSIFSKKSRAGLIDKEEETIKEWLSDVVCVMVDECFVGDTKVLTKNGYLPIKEIKPGDVVISYDTEFETFLEDEVVEVFCNMQKSMHDELYEICLENGDVIKVTENHMFLTHNRGWVPARDLTEDDNIVEYKNSKLFINSL